MVFIGCAKCRLVHVSATLSRSLPLVPKIKELTASLKVKYLLYGCLLIVCLPSEVGHLPDICKPIAGKILSDSTPLSEYNIQETNFVVVMVSKAKAAPKPAATSEVGVLCTSPRTQVHCTVC